MDWNKIEERHPKAYDKLNIWICDKFNSEGEKDYFLERWLFDFFDEQDIYIELTWGGKCWRYDIINPIYCNNLGYSKEKYKTRTEAEEKAFEKAFEILENKPKMEGVTRDDSRDL